MDVMVEGVRVMQVQKLLRERNIPFEVTAKDASALSPAVHRAKSPIYINRPRSPLSIPVSYDVVMAYTLVNSGSPGTITNDDLCSEGVMDWKDYYPLNIINNFLDSLEKHYPSTCTVIVIGKSVEGRDIKMLKISNSDATNTGVWLDGAIHAREWISTSVVTYIADHIARNFNSLPESITNKDWHFVPVVNPDGYHYTHTVDRMWRKNRARFGNNITGVDLNRNFGFYWGRNGADCSSGDPNHLNYRGTEPFSEPETAALKDIILYSGVPFKIFLTFHSYSEVISFPWCYTNEACPDYVNLLEGGTTMAKAIFETNGRMYKVGNFKDIMYYACGTSIDWSYGAARIPFSYLVELRSKQDRFLLPKEEIRDCCREALNAVKALAKFVDGKKCLNCAIYNRQKDNQVPIN